MGTNSKSYHKNLAKYFVSKPLYLDEPTQKTPNTRKLVEQPWQQTKGKRWHEVTMTLCNLDFIQAKAVAKMTYKLVDDINNVLQVIPENSVNIHRDKNRNQRMEKYTRDFLDFSTGEINTIEPPKTITQWDEEEKNVFIEQVRKNASRLDFLIDFKIFLGKESIKLQKYSDKFSNFAFQQAWNYADSGPVGTTAEKELKKDYKSLLLRSKSTRPIFNPLPPTLWITENSGSFENDFNQDGKNPGGISLTPDGKIIVSEPHSKHPLLWDLRTGQFSPILYKSSPVNSSSLLPFNAEISSDSWDTHINVDLAVLKNIKIQERYHLIENLGDIYYDGISSDMVNHSKIYICNNLTTGEPRKANHILNSAVFTPDGKKAIFRLEKSLIVSDLATGKHISILRGPTSGIVDATPDGKIAIADYEFDNCILWNLETGTVIKILKGHKHHVKSVAITPDGKKALTGSNDYTCILWDLETGKVLKTLSEHRYYGHSIAITSDGKIGISSTDNHNCVLWDLETGGVINILKGHKNTVQSVSITPDGKRAFTSSEYECILWDLRNGEILEKLYSGAYISYISEISDDGEIAISIGSNYCLIVWDLKAGTILNTLKYDNIIDNAFMSKDGSSVFCCSRDKTCVQWDFKKGSIIHHFTAIKCSTRFTNGKIAISVLDSTSVCWDIERCRLINILCSHLSNVNAVAITPDGKKAVIGSDNNCLLWDTEKGILLKILRGHTANVTSVAITPDASIAISGSYDNNCIIWDLEKGKVLQILMEHSSWVTSVNIAPDAKWAISKSEKFCILWNLESGKDLQRWKEFTRRVNPSSITPDGKKVISGSGGSTCVLWDMLTGEILTTMNGHKGQIWSVATTPDSSKAITTSFDKTCILWDLSSGVQLRILEGHDYPINSIVISHDSRLAITSTYEKTTSILWDLTTGELLYKLRNHSERVTCFVFSPDGKIAVSGSEDWTCKVWELRSGKILRTMNNHSDTINSICILPNGKKVISCSNDSDCILWDIETATIDKKLKGHTNDVDVVKSTPDGKIAVSGSQDNTIIVWDLETGNSTKKISTHTSGIRNLDISPDGKTAISSSFDNECFLWDLRSGKMMACFTSFSNIYCTNFFSMGIFIGCEYDRPIILNYSNQSQHKPFAISTACKIWDWDLQQYLDPSVNCPLCGHRFTPPVSVLQTILEINKKAGLSPDQSPCLELPDEAWEDPGLLSNCPKCGEKLKFNPFIAGGD